MRKGVANPTEPRETRVAGKESGKEGSKKLGKDLGKEAGKAVCQEAGLENSSKELDNAQKIEPVMGMNHGPLDPPEGGCQGGVGPVSGGSETPEIPGAAEALEDWGAACLRHRRRGYDRWNDSALQDLREWLNALPGAGFKEEDLLPRFAAAMGLSWKEEPRQVFHLFLLLLTYLGFVARMGHPVVPEVAKAVARRVRRTTYASLGPPRSGRLRVEPRALPSASNSGKRLPGKLPMRQILIRGRRVAA